MADRELSSRATDAQVAIVGAGPAGCAAALTLRRYLPELTVVVIAMPAITASAVGETLSPGVLPLLRYLGVDDFLQQGHLPCGGTASAWGSEQVFDRNYLFTGRGAGWHLDRARFDEWLLARAADTGAQVVRAAAMPGGASRVDGRWYVELEGGDAIQAEAVIDATGRTAWLARHHGAPVRDDGLVAEARWYVHDTPERSAEGALVEAAADGWWYSATLPERRAIAMFLTDADLRNRAKWEDRLADAPATRVRTGKWKDSGESAVRAAHSQRSPVVAGAGWVAAGDAAAAFDPISSLGIGFSLRSGMEAARVAAALLEGDQETAAAYAGSVARIYADYRARLKGIYRREARWPESVFWARRRS